MELITVRDLNSKGFYYSHRHNRIIVLYMCGNSFEKPDNEELSYTCPQCGMDVVKITFKNIEVYEKAKR